jgi:hypothetical protein
MTFSLTFRTKNFKNHTEYGLTEKMLRSVKFCYNGCANDQFGLQSKIIKLVFHLNNSCLKKS